MIQCFKALPVYDRRAIVDETKTMLRSSCSYGILRCSNKMLIHLN
ncbi:MAG: hypothetical protein QXQ75_01590 [Candidatus Nitrosocaldaceae archaeon]